MFVVLIKCLSLTAILVFIYCSVFIAVEALELLECQSAMLNDYFSIEILRSEEAEDLRGLYLSAIPSSVDGYAPQLEGLPALVKGLVSTVNWDEVRQLLCHLSY